MRHSLSRIGHSEDVDVGRSVDNSSSSPAQRYRIAEMEAVHALALASSALCALQSGEKLLHTL